MVTFSPFREVLSMAFQSFCLSSRYLIAGCFALGVLVSAFSLGRAEDKPTRSRPTEAELMRQLSAVPEVKLGEIGMPKKKPGDDRAKAPEFTMTARYLATRSDLVGLPMRMGAECKIDEKQARIMTNLSLEIRSIIGVTSENCGDDPEAIAIVLRKNLQRWRELREGDVRYPDPVPDFDTVRLFEQHYAVPTLMQMLTGEGAPVRLVLVEQIQRIGGWTASQALAKLAVYDPSSDVRAAALKALGTRPTDEYRDLLLNGLRYPWLPVVSNAAEALVSIKDRKAIPVLEKLATEPDPSLPFKPTRASEKELGTQVVREVVRINHLSNCMMCHAQSEAGSDGVRGVVPIPGESLPSPSKYYVKGDVFARADTTYLRQDFSMRQEVKDHGKWPKLQRFDFIVRTRAATEEDLRRKPNPAYRETLLNAVALLKADRALTQK
jgi:hypothetical protein